VRLLQRNMLVVLMGSLLMVLICDRAEATPDACALVPRDKIAQIIGNDAPILTQQPTSERGGAKVSSCVYQQSSGAGNTANISITTLDSPVAAQARLKQYSDALVKSGGTSEPDSVGGLTAIFITSKGGQGQMFVVRGSVLVGAGVGGVVGGKVKPRRDLARLLMAAVLAAV
jgi:hypothetical protein